MANIPTPVGSGLVTAQFIAAASDSIDPDAIPDAIAVSGIITFVPSVPYIRVPNVTGVPNAQTILLDKVTGILDSEGYLCRNYVDPDTGGYVRGVPLTATAITGVAPEGWTWNVSYSLSINGIGVAGPAEHGLQILPGQTTDLTLAAPVTFSGGVITTRGPQGVPGPSNLVVGPTNTLTMPGLWVQTGLGASGNDFTLWIEDGK